MEEGRSTLSVFCAYFKHSKLEVHKTWNKAAVNWIFHPKQAVGKCNTSQFSPYTLPRMYWLTCLINNLLCPLKAIENLVLVT